jgi:hypothetical protein
MFTSACTCTARGSSTAGRGVSRWSRSFPLVVVRDLVAGRQVQVGSSQTGAWSPGAPWFILMAQPEPARGAPGAELLAQPHPLPNRRRGGQGDPLQQFRRRPAALPGRQPGGVQVRPGPVGDLRGRGDPERVNQPPHPLRDTGRPEQVLIGQPPHRPGRNLRQGLTGGSQILRPARPALHRPLQQFRGRTHLIRLHSDPPNPVIELVSVLRNTTDIPAAESNPRGQTVETPTPRPPVGGSEAAAPSTTQRHRVQICCAAEHSATHPARSGAGLTRR